MLGCCRCLKNPNPRVRWLGKANQKLRHCFVCSWLEFRRLKQTLGDRIIFLIHFQIYENTILKKRSKTNISKSDHKQRLRLFFWVCLPEHSSAASAGSWVAVTSELPEAMAAPSLLGGQREGRRGGRHTDEHKFQNFHKSPPLLTFSSSNLGLESVNEGVGFPFKRLRIMWKGQETKQYEHMKQKQRSKERKEERKKDAALIFPPAIWLKVIQSWRCLHSVSIKKKKQDAIKLVKME